MTSIRRKTMLRFGCATPASAAVTAPAFVTAAQGGGGSNCRGSGSTQEMDCVFYDY